MKVSRVRVVFATALIMVAAAGCATTKTLHTWKDDGYGRKLGKTMTIFVTENADMRAHFENVLAQRLGDNGVEAIASNKALPDAGAKPARETVVAKVKELAIENVAVSRVLGKEEYSRLVPGGVYLVAAAFYTPWSDFYDRSYSVVAVSGSSYDVEYFNVLTNVYDVHSEKLVWSYISRVKVENSRQGAVNPFIETVIKQLKDAELI